MRGVAIILSMMAQTTSASHDPVKQFSVFTENRVGRLHELTALLKQNDVHVMAITVLDTVFDPEPVSDFVTLMGACQLRTMRPFMAHPRWDELDPGLRALSHLEAVEELLRPGAQVDRGRVAARLLEPQDARQPGDRLLRTR